MYISEEQWERIMHPEKFKKEEKKIEICQSSIDAMLHAEALAFPPDPHRIDDEKSENGIKSRDSQTT